MSDRAQLREVAGEAVELGALIDYQPGAIVSRTLVDEESATLTVFALDEDEHISEHTAPHDAILQVLDGTATVTLEGEDHEVTAGETIVMPANVPHAVGAATRCKTFLTMIR